jgi:omega-6 fatty acid desaturase (delta-12 desaturase)
MVLTVDEYLELPSWKRLGYRFLRNPFVMFAVGPLIVFLIVHRFAHRTAGKRERYSVIWTNLILLGILVFMGLTIGIKAFVLVHLPILVLGTSFGVWLFYVQHQFEGVYWERHENWSFSAAGLQGSSFYQLPKLLQWFTGNIGFHHIHHLSPRIPNYFLERCHNENPVFDQVKPLTFLSSLKSLTFRLWDEKNRKLVGYSHLKIAQG